MSVLEVILFWYLWVLLGIFVFSSVFVCVWLFVVGVYYDETDGNEDTDLDKALRGEKEGDNSHDH